MMHYYWSVFNVFLGAVVGDTLTTQITQFVENSSSIGTTLGRTLPGSSNFFINYLALRALGMVPMKLLFHNAVNRQISIVLGKIVRKCAPAVTSCPWSCHRGRIVLTGLRKLSPNVTCVLDARAARDDTRPLFHSASWTCHVEYRSVLHQPGQL